MLGYYSRDNKAHWTGSSGSPTDPVLTSGQTGQDSSESLKDDIFGPPHCRRHGRLLPVSSSLKVFTGSDPRLSTCTEVLHPFPSFGEYVFRTDNVVV